MKTPNPKWTAALLLLSLIPNRVPAAEPALKVGDPAPKLQTGQWVQGEPVKQFEKGKAYIVEFWATWCGPCRVSIPHLNEVDAKFKDRGLVVIGQDCWERDDNLVAPFVQQMAGKMTYRVALDDKQGGGRGKMAETWMAAADQNGIPTAFVVDPTGRIAWINHPMQLTDELIEAVLAGKHDLKKALAEFMDAHRKMEERRAAQVPISRVYQAIQKKDWDEAFSRLAEAEKILPKESASALHLQILLAQRDYAAVCDLAEKLYHDSAGNPVPPAGAAEQLNELAWRMAIDPAISSADLARAETIARWADDDAKHNNANIIDTLARVLFRRGKQSEAVALQAKAVNLANDSLKPGFEKTLASYKNGELPEAK